MPTRLILVVAALSLHGVAPAAIDPATQLDASFALNNFNLIVLNMRW